MTGEEFIDEVTMLFGDHGVERLKRRLLPASLAHIVHRHGEVDTVGTTVDVLVDPVQFDLELLGAEGQRTEHTEPTGIGDRCHDIATVGEGEDGELNPQTLRDRCAHCISLIAQGLVGDFPALCNILHKVMDLRNNVT